MRQDRLIEVCSSCKMACCWYGEIMCDQSRNAGTILIRKSKLKELNLEHSHYWSNKKLKEVYGCIPEYSEEPNTTPAA